MTQPPAPSAKSFIAQRIANSRGPVNRLRARRFGLDLALRRSPALELYYEAGDPHSHLCAQLLPVLAQRLKTPLRVFVVPPPTPGSYPEAARQRDFALIDAKRIAPAFGLQFDHQARLPDADQAHRAALQLTSIQDPIHFAQTETDLATALFGDADLTVAESSSANELKLQGNARRRQRLGHYLPAMWQFNGEWFWGLDRLDILEQRLREKNLLEGRQPLAEFNAAHARLPMLVPGQALEFFFSFRSPYSYLAALDMQRLLPKLSVNLEIRPVLPMAMRGLPVPLDKRLYIVRDVKRRADQLGYAFGRIADPIGAGAERCLNIFPLARTTRQQLDYLVAAGTAIWSQGIDVASDSGLGYVAEGAGMDRAAVEAKLADGPDLDYAEQNRKALFEAGLWGVPSFRIGSFATWGQDRLWMIEELLRRG